MIEETLNERLRNKIQPFHTLIEILEMYRSGGIDDNSFKNFIKSIDIDKLKDLEYYLIG